METPNDINGIRTELIMADIKERVFDGRMDVSLYNKIYSTVYNSLCKISIKNLAQSMKHMGIKLFDTKVNP